MNFTSICDNIFEKCIIDYHITDDVNASIQNPYKKNEIEHLLYHKNWIDTVQWHLEDIIRNPEIDPVEALYIKRRIDASNQERTDMVEYLDAYFLNKYKEVLSLNKILSFEEFILHHDYGATSFKRKSS